MLCPKGVWSIKKQHQTDSEFAKPVTIKISWSMSCNHSKVSYIELHVRRISLKPLLVHDDESHAIKQVKGPLIFWEHILESQSECEKISVHKF